MPMKDRRTKNIAGADDVVSLCFNPGLEHPGASKTDMQRHAKKIPANNKAPVDSGCRCAAGGASLLNDSFRGDDSTLRLRAPK